MRNVLLITVDSLRADYVFGRKAPESLDTLPRLAAEGLNFTTAFSNAGYTKASFLSILSGTYPWMFESVQGGFGPDRPHVAELLSDAGYATGGFHTNTYLGPAYNYDRGFDHYAGRDAEGGDGDATSVGTAINGLVQRALAVEELSEVVHRVYSTTGKRLGVQLGSHLYKPADELNDAVLDWTRECDRPAFVWVHYMDVHNPYYPHEGTVSEGISRRKAVKLFHRVNEQRGDASEDDIETLERLYRGEIEYLDAQLGEFLNRLDATLGMDETLVAFASDHGEAFNENGRVFHPGSALYDENIHVPLVLRGPGIPRGEIETPVSNVDIVPTLLSTAGLDPPDAAVGEDLTRFLADPPDDRLVFAEAYSREDGRAMVTDGRHKLIRHMGTDEETLYVRRSIPGKSRDRAVEDPEVRRELSAALDAHVRAVGESRGRRGDVDVTENVRLRLRKLGYDE